MTGTAVTLFDLNGEQRFTGTLVGGGGAQSPTLLTLGPYTIDHTTTGATAVIDLGADIIGVLKLAEFVLTAVNFDGGDPGAGLALDVISARDAAFTDTAGIPTAWLGAFPSSFVSPVVPATLRANGGTCRYVHVEWQWAGDQGAAAAATFHVNLTYF